MGNDENGKRQYNVFHNKIKLAINVIRTYLTDLIKN